MSDYPHDHNQTSRSTADGAKAEAQNLKDDITQKASEAGAQAAEAVRGSANDAKNSFADEISSVGNALRRASDDLRTGSPQERTFGQMAGSLADLSDNIRGKDLGEMVDDLSSFARRNPTAFLGGAALLGFAAMRVAKASQRDRNQPETLPVPARNTAPVASPQVRPHGSNNPMGDQT